MSRYTINQLFFFFQAEDGIRDLTVTGVQTCALPIWRRRTTSSATRRSAARSTAICCASSSRPTSPGGPRRSRSRHPWGGAGSPRRGLARLLELVPWRPPRHRRRVGDAEADHQVELRVLDRAGEVPVAVIFVGDLVVVVPLVLLVHLLPPARRPAGEARPSAREHHGHADLRQ